MGGSPAQNGRKLAVALSSESQLKEAKLCANFRQALEFLGMVPPKGKFLDVGCGTGVFSKLVEKLGFEVYALDPATEAIRYAQEKFGLKNIVAGTIDDIPLDWQQLEFITAFEVLEHLEQPRQLAKKIYQLLAPGGYFMMSVPNRDRLGIKLGRREEWDYPPSHLTRWSKEALKFFLTDIGFTNVTVKIDGINRWTLGNVLLPSKFNQEIVRRKLSGLPTPSQTEREFFLYNWLWRFVQKVGDGIALLCQPLARLYGTYLVAFAQKPCGAV